MENKIPRVRKKDFPLEISKKKKNEKKEQNNK